MRARMFRVFGLVLAVLACLVLGVGLGALKWRGSQEDYHRFARMQAILAQAQQMPNGGVLVIGDSITEMVRFDRLCGLPALNAGIGWSTSRDWVPDAPKVIRAVHPSIVVLAVGTNDGGDWHDDYRRLAKLSTFAVVPSDPARAAFVRSIIRAVPAPTSTVDGKHPDAAGAKQWIAAVEQGCARWR